MRAIDTNIIVRYLTRDHPHQSPKAQAVIEQDNVFVCATVLLETEWVLRSVYGYSPALVCAALRAFAGLPCVRLDQPDVIVTALQWAEQGMDFADALHLAQSQHCISFISFDAKMAKLAKTCTSLHVVNL
jgi:predicted nucleic-acid-binding protein